MEEIIQYFDGQLKEDQIQKLSKLKELYVFWNDQINVISRKDLDNFYERHVLHSLGIAKIIRFKEGSRVLDVGTGGGFPGIPLAIFFPHVQFVLVDSIGKKIKVVNEVIHALGLTNVVAYHQRAEKVEGKFDFIISRAVTRMKGFIPWVRKKVKRENLHDLTNGILYLKGGDLKEEMSEITQSYQEFALSDFFDSSFFDTKKVIHVKL